MGVGGFVIDAAVRDADGLAECGMPVFARPVPAGPYKRGPGRLHHQSQSPESSYSRVTSSSPTPTALWWCSVLKPNGCWPTPSRSRRPRPRSGSPKPPACVGSKCWLTVTVGEICHRWAQDSDYGDGRIMLARSRIRACAQPTHHFPPWATALMIKAPPTASRVAGAENLNFTQMSDDSTKMSVSVSMDRSR